VYGALVYMRYRAPEVLLGQAQYPCSADIWSAGCVLGEMAGGNVHALFALVGGGGVRWWG
jgi:serine/threonine protein kinase